MSFVVYAIKWETQYIQFIYCKNGIYNGWVYKYRKNDSPKGEEDVIPVPVVISVDSNGGL